ncbi:SEC14-like protein 2, partial [Orchesella cincta]
MLFPSKTFSTIVGLILLVSCFSFISTQEETLSATEKAALEEFKLKILPKIPESSYVHKFAKDDLYLINWLRAGNWKVKSAMDLLMKHLEWRENESIDTIEKEDWANVIKEFPVFFDSVDKSGKPIIEVWFAEWQTRKAVLAGRLSTLSRMTTLAMESTSRKIWESRAEGKNVTQMIFLGELEGASVIQHMCPACLPVYLTMATNMENHYPYFVNKLYLMNMPASFDIILRLLKPILRASTRETITPYVNKDQWMKVLDETIDKNQRSVRFGGTIVRE